MLKSRCSPSDYEFHLEPAADEGIATIEIAPPLTMQEVVHLDYARTGRNALDQPCRQRIIQSVFNGNACGEFAQSVVHPNTIGSLGKQATILAFYHGQMEGDVKDSLEDIRKHIVRALTHCQSRPDICNC